MFTSCLVVVLYFWRVFIFVVLPVYLSFLLCACLCANKRVHSYFSSGCTFSTSHSFSFSWHHSYIVSPRLRQHHVIPPVSLSLVSTLPLVSNFLIVTIHSVISSSSSAACALHAFRIELNPGSSNFTVCTLNICSILHTFHSAVLSDLLDRRKPFLNLD